MRRLYNHITGKQVKITGTAAIPFVDFMGKHIYILSTAVTSGVTPPPVGSATGDFATTTHSTGRNSLFYSDGTHLVTITGGAPAQAANVAALTGAGSGTADGALQAEGTLSTAGGNTYSDAAVNTVLGKIENNIAEVAAKLEAIRASLVAAGLMA
jgi:hypothetical protein